MSVAIITSADSKGEIHHIALDKAIISGFTKANKEIFDVRGQIAGVLKYVLKKEKLEGYDIIRLKEYTRVFRIRAV